MSFFGQLLAGAVGGAAGGYIKDREEDDRLAEKQALKQEQYAQQLLLQRERQQDRIDMFQMTQAGKAGKGDGGSGGAGTGKGDFNLAAMVYEAAQSGDPAKIRAAEQVATLMGGDQAREHVRYSLGVGNEDKAPTEQDVLASMATDGKEYTPEPPKGGTRGQREAAEGLQAFQRAYARGVTKVKDQAEGEKQEFGNDAAAAEYNQMLAGGASIEEANDMLNRRLNPAKADPLAEERLALQREEAKRKAASAADGNTNRAQKILVDRLKVVDRKLKDGGMLMDDTERTELVNERNEINAALSAAPTQAAPRAPTAAPAPRSTGKTGAAAPVSSVRSMIKSKGY